MAARRPTLLERVERDHDRLANSILSSVERLPAYAKLPKAELRGEVLPVLHHGLRTTFRLLRVGDSYTPADLAPFQESAARRADSGFSLPDLLSAYHLAGQALWQVLSAEASPDEYGELLRLTDRGMTGGRVLCTSLVTAYLEERQRLEDGALGTRRAVAAALVRGVPAERLAARAGVVLAASYLVVAIRLTCGLDQHAGWAERGADLLRGLELRLAETHPHDSLGWLTQDGGVLLIPATVGEVETISLELPPLLQSLERAAGSPIVAASAWRPTRAEVAAAVEEAREVLQLAVAIGRPPGLYRLDDVLLESVLVRPSVVAERLVQLLTPLAEGPALLETLEAFLGADLDRRRAANALHIHPNTLDYRLRRVHELTGLAPTTTHGLQLLGAALIVWRLRGGTPGTPSIQGSGSTPAS